MPDDALLPGGLVGFGGARKAVGRRDRERQALPTGNEGRRRKYDRRVDPTRERDKARRTAQAGQHGILERRTRSAWTRGPREGGGLLIGAQRNRPQLLKRRRAKVLGDG